MDTETRYKIGREIVGPRQFEEVIRSGALPVDTPLQLAFDGLWTDLEGAEKKLIGLRKPTLPRTRALRFITVNIIVAFVGYFWPVASLIAAGVQYLTGVVTNYLEEGKKRPAAAFATLITMLFPLFVIVGSGERAKSYVLWLIFSGFFQLVLFFIFMRLNFA